jgi:hypothetical protein
MLCELVPGGVSKEITAGQAAHILGLIMPSGAGWARTQSFGGRGIKSGDPRSTW